MKLERLRPTTVRVTLHTCEWTSLVAAARCALEHEDGEGSPGARDRRTQVLVSYDAERHTLEVPNRYTGS